MNIFKPEYICVLNQHKDICSTLSDTEINQYFENQTLISLKDYFPNLSIETLFLLNFIYGKSNDNINSFKFVKSFEISTFVSCSINEKFIAKLDIYNPDSNPYAALLVVKRLEKKGFKVPDFIRSFNPFFTNNIENIKLLELEDYYYLTREGWSMVSEYPKVEIEKYPLESDVTCKENKSTLNLDQGHLSKPLYKLYQEIETENNEIRRLVQIDRYFSKMNMQTGLERFDEYIIRKITFKSNRAISIEAYTEIYKQIVESDLEYESRGELFFQIKIDVNFNYAKCREISETKSASDGTIVIPLIIEPLLENQVIRNYEDAILIRWFTYNYRAIERRLPNWFSYKLDISSPESRMNEAVELGYLEKAPLFLTIEITLATSLIKGYIQKRESETKLSKLSKIDLISILFALYTTEEIETFLLKGHVYVLTSSGIDLCNDFYKNAPQRIKDDYTYMTFFTGGLQWNYNDEVEKLNNLRVKSIQFALSSNIIMNRGFTSS